MPSKSASGHRIGHRGRAQTSTTFPRPQRMVVERSHVTVDGADRLERVEVRPSDSSDGEHGQPAAHLTTRRCTGRPCRQSFSDAERHRWTGSWRRDASRLKPDDSAPIPRGAGSSHVTGQRDGPGARGQAGRRGRLVGFTGQCNRQPVCRRGTTGRSARGPGRASATAVPGQAVVACGHTAGGSEIGW